MSDAAFTRRSARTALLCSWALLSLCSTAQAQEPSEATGLDAINGTLRLRLEDLRSQVRGPLAAANEVLAGTASSTPSAATVDLALRGQWQWLNAAVVLQHRRAEGGASHSSAVVNELYAATALGEQGAWQLSAGRRALSWDVGYAFRPNDMVAQEERRTLLSQQLKGRPLLAAEYFDAESAWTLVWVNPQNTRHERRADEQALAARYYQRIGGLDTHAFARWGEHSHASLGAALAWVANESLELHGSLRWARSADALLAQAQAPIPAAQLPWQPGSRHHLSQALVGLSWTGESRLSLLAEAWWDGNAASPAEWRLWQARGQSLQALIKPGISPALRTAVAGNLAWQAMAFDGGSSLHRSNVFLRASWEHEGWSPALDLLYHPADRGHVLTASLGWQGDRLRVDAGLRRYGGPAQAVLAQLPIKTQAYAALTWAF